MSLLPVPPVPPLVPAAAVGEGQGVVVEDEVYISGLPARQGPLPRLTSDVPLVGL